MGERRRTSRAATAVGSAVTAVALLALGACSSSDSPTPAAPSVAEQPSAHVPGQPLAPLPAAGSRSGPRLCGKTDQTQVAGGRFVVQNNEWGSDDPQCTTAFDTGFSVQSDHHKADSPAAYPSIVYGCNYGTCTKGSPFPLPVPQLGDIRSSWAFTAPQKGDYDAAYDVWLDPTPRREGYNKGAELMIWMDHTDKVHPIGQKKTTATVGGTQWDVYTGENGGTPVISYVRTQPTHQVTDLPITDFVHDAQTQGVVKPEWYLTNIQAGFEPWVGGTGLSTDGFALTRNGV